MKVLVTLWFILKTKVSRPAPSCRIIHTRHLKNYECWKKIAIYRHSVMCKLGKPGGVASTFMEGTPSPRTNWCKLILHFRWLLKHLMYSSKDDQGPEQGGILIRSSQVRPPLFYFLFYIQSTCLFFDAQKLWKIRHSVKIYIALPSPFQNWHGTSKLLFY